jgi:hypothetical protein
MKNKTIPTQPTAMLSLASGVFADWDCTRPLQNVCVDTQYIGVIEEQKQK